MFSCCYCQQQDDHFIIRTMEKLPVHTEVVNLRRLLFSKNFSDNINVDFTLVKRDEFPYMYFLINHSSRGILTIRKEIDRDELCRLRRCRCDTWCDLELEIIINSEKFNIELITIRIIDRNDHKPIFLNNYINLTIVENAQIGQMIKLEAAIDYDQGKNSIIGYSLVSSTSLPFSLHYNLIRGDLSLVVEEKLDRELISSYIFDIIAVDGDNQTGLLHVFVIIDDINDSPPKFEQSIYIINNISETISIDSIICRVHAIDDDEGVNGEINYYLISHDDCFHIDPITGDIRVRCLLDYETQTIYRLEIEARDRGEGYKTDFCTVLIHILDENDNTPIIDIYPHDIELDTNSIKLYLNESLPINSLILSISIIDRDSGDNGRVTWKLNESSLIPFELIRLTENTGELRTKNFLDYEYISEYNLILEAHDHGRPLSKLTYLNIFIIIIDENDNKPKFQDNHMIATINEHVKFNNPYGYEIFHLHAYDYDQGLNGEIIYSIINNNEKIFQIDSNTGIIRAMIEFDRSQQDTYIIQVEARDKGTPSLSSRGTITFRVISQNEYSPVCNINNSNNISWSIMENSAYGTIIGIISCYDDDKDEPNGEISVYSHWFPDEKIIYHNKYMIPFEIITRKSNTSESTIFIILSVNGSIDREIIPFYKLRLTISDHGNPPQSINILISIEILDENDHCPQLHIESSFIMINRDITQKYFLINLIAYDNDTHLNGNITFELLSLSSSISSSYINLYSNGTLSVQTDSNLIKNDSLILLHIQIRDHGQPKPCRIVETLRLFIGSNKTNWLNIVKNNNYDSRSLNLDNEGFQQGKRMAHAYSISSSSISSPLFQYTSINLLSTRKHIFAVFIGSSILMFIVILTMVLCFIDCIQKNTKQKNNKLSIIKTNGINHHNTIPLTKCKHNLTVSPTKTTHFYKNNSSTPHYKSLISTPKTKPTIAISSSNSHSSSLSSSVDSTTRANTAHNRAMTNTYTYVALSTSDDLMPADFDNNTNNDGDNNGIELMMTTV
ncbi:unnamed protein product [Rotaria sp. Silwood1]|nr:unnamed protein product [Rotaria sp. Silwood1]CAF0842193.1 unnamed protein product [Rotaria sp. Silwood1]CAF3401133.1 unnamed protein product [Rotaria sp. Silwood1]CAF3416990.1 unnamed protein product [Rotaria sp. Silwood1]CAF3433250.1 unnamed protein product [Rotaria sp. Silwood1]